MLNIEDSEIKFKKQYKLVLSFAIPLNLWNGSRSVMHLIQAGSISSMVPLRTKSYGH